MLHCGLGKYNFATDGSLSENKDYSLRICVELFSEHAEFNTNFTDFNANGGFLYNELHTLFICARQACFYYV